MEEYNNYKLSFLGKDWDFMKEAEKYCNIDCISLHEVVNKFSEMIFNKFSLNIDNYSTIPSLAFAIWRAKYLNNIDPDKNIHQLSGTIARDIRLSYTGGSVDLYIPRAVKGTKIFCYDVNSLYPYVMKTFKMPVGAPTYFKGDITKLENNPFGFFYCNIIAPPLGIT